MLKKFSVMGYRNFKDEVTLDLTDTHDYRFNSQYIRNGIINNALIYGKNASGKTNLGRALMDVKTNLLLRRDPSDSDDRSIRMHPYRDDASFLNADSGDATAGFEYDFLLDGHDVVYRYTKDANGALRKEKLLVDEDIVFDYDHVDRRMLRENLALIGAESLNSSYSNEFSSLLAYYSNSVPPKLAGILHQLRRFIFGMSMLRLGDTGGPSPSVLMRIIDGERVSELQQFLNDYGVDERLTTRTEADGRRALYFQHKRPIPFYRNCSSGTAALVRIFASYEMTPLASFYFLDEFDANCHFEMAEKLIRHFGESQTCQTVATTHNTSLLSNGIMRPDCFFLLSSKRQLNSLPNLTSRELREGHNLERLFRGGEFD